MLDNERVRLLRANQRFLVEELETRGISVEVYDYNNEIILGRLGQHKELFLDLDSSLMPYTATTIASSKSITKRILSEAGITVPRGRSFGCHEITEALSFSHQLRFPCVVKPSVGSQGKNVYMDLHSRADIEHAVNHLEQELGDVEYILEEQFSSKEYRIFVTKTGNYAALHRDPAAIIGDGRSTIRAIATKESHRRLNPRNTCLGEIVLDPDAERFLRRRGLTFDSIPALDEKVYLRNCSNVSLGGIPEDVTDILHESVLKICIKALNAIPGLPYAGIDFMSDDISKPQNPWSYRILEINSLPGIGIHMAPGKGKSRNVAAMIVDLVFPETIKNNERYLKVI